MAQLVFDVDYFSLLFLSCDSLSSETSFSDLLLMHMAQLVFDVDLLAINGVKPRRREF